MSIGNITGGSHRKSQNRHVSSLMFRINFATLTADIPDVNIINSSGLYTIEIKRNVVKVLSCRLSNITTGNPVTTATLRNSIAATMPTVGTYSYIDNSGIGVGIRFSLCLRNLVDGSIKTPEFIDVDLTISNSLGAV